MLVKSSTLSVIPMQTYLHQYMNETKTKNRFPKNTVERTAVCYFLVRTNDGFICDVYRGGGVV